eukprot:gnl/MRDRNA2_/MRDRNA2_34295_c0_seq1.p1 gnl/MRDRNA2_/MRDRNA2_34295_c0~~gnl/MRDRNA2_/MRDRNA2_34295_c0_seq1.p1  ORF type:complete len:881 (-),score=171.58 gnl/MRDRNA2_/MRDRNA2_34295_c0_seq1:108-2750(-)
MLDFRVELLQATSERTSKFNEISSSYRREQSYFHDMASNVKAELVAAFIQGCRAPGRISLHSERAGAPWMVTDTGSETLRNMKGCIVEDLTTHEVFWISSCARKNDAGIPMGLQSLEQKNNENLALVVDGLDVDGNKGTINAKKRTIQVVLFANDYAARFAAAKAGASQKLKQADSDLLKMVLQPSAERKGTFEPVINAAAQLNASQKRAVYGLERRLEVIHGPPGTGKSTTISGLLQTRLPSNRTAIVTCVTNQAIDAVCHKLEPGCVEMPFLVVGNWENLGTIARKYLLDEQVKRDGKVKELYERLTKLRNAIAEAEAQLEKSVTRESKATWRGNLESLNDRHKLLRKKFDERWVETERMLVAKCRCFLCTIASLYRISSLREQFERECEGAPHTAILDEAGATPESYVPQVLGTGVENLVLLGDHKQLPPLVMTMDPVDTEQKNVKRSLMERALDQMPDHWIHMLTEQYRMHPSICNMVSKLFYSNLVKTAGQNPDWNEPTMPSGTQVAPIRWQSIKQPEVAIGTSKVNLAEAAAIVAWLEWEAPQAWCQNQTVKCITFYKLQRDLIRSCLADELAECVVSVDASQGSESDHIILSTVRSNSTRDVGFCADPRRLCVALSRAKVTLTIVGDHDCMNRGQWAEVLQRVQEWQDAWHDAGIAMRVEEQFKRMKHAKQKPCRFHLEGRCTKAECPFTHDAKPSQEVLQSLREAADPCVFHAQGRCTKGKDCTFSHDFKPGDEEVIARLRKAGLWQEVEPCKYFMLGKCSNGANCTFSHAFGPGDKKVAAALSSNAEPCRFYAAGKCTNGTRCPFSHDFKRGDKNVVDSLRKTAEPCKFFDMGTCTNGRACTFSHDFVPKQAAKASGKGGYPVGPRSTKRR